jgi:hypothetical protein
MSACFDGEGVGQGGGGMDLTHREPRADSRRAHGERNNELRRGFCAVNALHVEDGEIPRGGLPPSVVCQKGMPVAMGSPGEGDPVLPRGHPEDGSLLDGQRLQIILETTGLASDTVS